MLDRFVHLMFHIDANRINARQRAPSMNRLEKWHKDGVIMLEMCEVSLGEAATGSKARAQKASGYVYSLTYADTADEKKRIDQIACILFPAGVKDKNQQNDVEIVFNAAKYCRVLVTNDGGSRTQPGGILGNADALSKSVRVRVVSDGDAVKMVEGAIRNRDERARHIAKKRGIQLPDWVGKD